MTKIALCYSGRPRSVLECFENHREHFLLGQNNVDVFAHLWFDENLTGSNFRSDVGQGTWPDSRIKDWIDINWQPKKILYEQPRSFENFFPSNKGDSSKLSNTIFLVLTSFSLSENSLAFEI